MKTYNMICITLIFLLVCSCKKQEVNLFDQEVSGIYFQKADILSWYNRSERYADSADFSFSAAPVATMDTILNVRIRTMGKVKNYPRPIKLTVDPLHTTAIQGKHYDIDLASASIPAGESETAFPVKFYRTEDLLNNKISLSLLLQDNEHFKVYITKQKNTNVYTGTGDTINANKYLFLVSELYTEPDLWRIFGDEYFGKWTIKKMKYLNSIVKWSIEDWVKSNTSNDSPVKLGRFHIVALLVRAALQAQADAHTPVLDEDGKPMQLGANYLVNYL